jgi:hypothetical protein
MRLHHLCCFVGIVLAPLAVVIDLRIGIFPHMHLTTVTYYSTGGFIYTLAYRYLLYYIAEHLSSLGIHMVVSKISAAKIQICANIHIQAVTAVKHLPFMAQNSMRANKSSKIPTVAYLSPCLLKFWYACHC